MPGNSCLNKLDVTTKGTKQCSNPQALSSTLTVLGKLQPQTFGLLNHLVPLALVSNYCLVSFGLKQCDLQNFPPV